MKIFTACASCARVCVTQRLTMNKWMEQIVFRGKCRNVVFIKCRTTYKRWRLYFVSSCWRHHTDDAAAAVSNIPSFSVLILIIIYSECLCLGARTEGLRMNANVWLLLDAVACFYILFSITNDCACRNAWIFRFIVRSQLTVFNVKIYCCAQRGFSYGKKIGRNDAVKARNIVVEVGRVCMCLCVCVWCIWNGQITDGRKRSDHHQKFSISSAIYAFYSIFTKW